MSAPLAHAFLALADADEPADQRSLPRALTAAAAALVLALGVPLSFLAASPHEQPVAALSSKFTLDDE